MRGGRSCVVTEVEVSVRRRGRSPKSGPGEEKREMSEREIRDEGVTNENINVIGSGEETQDVSLGL